MATAPRESNKERKGERESAHTGKQGRQGEGGERKEGSADCESASHAPSPKATTQKQQKHKTKQKTDERGVKSEERAHKERQKVPAKPTQAAQHSPGRRVAATATAAAASAAATFIPLGRVHQSPRDTALGASSGAAAATCCAKAP